MRELKNTAIIIGGIFLFLFCVAAQNIITRSMPDKANLNGVFMMIQTLDSVLLAVLAYKKGFITSFVLNAINFFYTFIFVILINHKTQALPGLAGGLITIATCWIIYMYSKKIQDSTDEIMKKNEELIETNRVIREKDETLVYLAYYDVLTGLANRRLFVDEIDTMIKTDEPFSVVIADIDDFKRIIDMYGHNTGDILINTYAERLRDYSRKNDFIAKFGEEEFAIIIKGTSDNAEIIKYIEDLRIALCAPVDVNNTPIQLTMSFGVSEYPANGMNSSEILRNTDIAVTNAKMSGRGRIFFLNQNRCI